MSEIYTDQPNFIFQFFTFNNSWRIIFWIDSETKKLNIFADGVGSEHAELPIIIQTTFSEFMDRTLSTDVDLSSIIRKLMSAGWRYEKMEAQWSRFTLDTLIAMLGRMTATNARKWVLNTLGRKDLNTELQRAMKTNNTLWKNWFAYDFPDIVEHFGLVLPRWITEIEPDDEDDLKTNPWRRYYMWMHYFIMNSMRFFIENENNAFAEPDPFVHLKIVDVNTIRIIKTDKWSQDFSATDIYKFSSDERFPKSRFLYLLYIRMDFSTRPFFERLFYIMIEQGKDINAKVQKRYQKFLRQSQSLSFIDLVIERKMFRSLPRNYRGYLNIGNKIV